MAGILGSWRHGFSYVMMFMLAAAVLTLMNHRDFAEPAREVRLTLTNRIMEDKNYEPGLRTKIQQEGAEENCNPGSRTPVSSGVGCLLCHPNTSFRKRWEVGDRQVYTVYLKWITNKDLLQGTGNSAQC